MLALLNYEPQFFVKLGREDMILPYKAPCLSSQALMEDSGAIKRTIHNISLAYSLYTANGKV